MKFYVSSQDTLCAKIRMVHRESGKSISAIINYGKLQNLHLSPAIYPSETDMISQFGDTRVHGCLARGDTRDWYEKHGWILPDFPLVVPPHGMLH